MTEPLTNSPAPGVPQTADKAKAGAVVAGVALGVALILALYFDGRNGTDFAEVLISVVVALVGGGAPGGAVFKTKNRAKHKAPHRG